MEPILKEEVRELEKYKTIIRAFIGLYCFSNKIVLKKINGLKDDALNNCSFGKISLKFKAYDKFKNYLGLIAYSFSDRKIQYLKEIFTEDDFIEKMEGHFGHELFTLVCCLPDGKFPDSKKYFTNSFFNCLKKFERNNFDLYRFICGSGLSYNYLGENSSWEQIGKLFKKKAASILGNKEDVSNIKDGIFNTNYGSFQLLKDIDIDEYNHLLKSLVEPNNLYFEKVTTLTAVGETVIKQSRKCNCQTILTFNYDDILEEYLKHRNFNEFYSSYKKENYDEKKLIIKHAHGFLPRNSIKPDHMKHIVLTDEEYKKAYLYNKNFTFDSLYTQLDSTCYFVGNSLCDYEEQKVIKRHFEKNPASFHFCFASENKSNIYKFYKTLFFLRMGIIILWYDEHKDYAYELMHYANELK